MLVCLFTGLWTLQGKDRAFFYALLSFVSIPVNGILWELNNEQRDGQMGGQRERRVGRWTEERGGGR